MKPIVIIVAGLVAGIGGGTAVSALKVKGQVEAEMVARADSLAELTAADEQGGTGIDDGSHETSPDGEGLESEGLEGDGHESSAAEADPNSVEGAPDGDAVSEASGDEPVTPGAAAADDSPGTASDTPGVAATPPSTPPSTQPETPAANAVTAEGARRMAKIFAAMRAEDATAVLIELENVEVAAILGELSDRQAAAILGNFPSDRAAILGRMMLGGTV